MNEKRKAEILEQATRMVNVVKSSDGKFLRLIGKGLLLLWAILAGAAAVLSGETAEFTTALDELKASMAAEKKVE